MSERPVRAAIDHLRGALRQRLLEEERGHLILDAGAGREPEAPTSPGGSAGATDDDVPAGEDPAR